MKKRLFSLALAACMALALVPAVTVGAGAYSLDQNHYLEPSDALQALHEPSYADYLPQEPCLSFPGPNPQDASLYEDVILSTEANDQTINTAFTYDDADRLTAMTSFSGTYRAEYTYDSAGNLTAVHNRERNISGEYSIPRDDSLYTYDSAGNLLKSDKSTTSSGAVNRTVCTYSYNTAGRLTAQSCSRSGKQDYSYTYSYTASGLLSRISGTSSGAAVNFYFKSDGKLAKYTVKSASSSRTAVNTYDASGRVVRSEDAFTGTNGSRTLRNDYVYNSAGNIVSYKEYSRSGSGAYALIASQTCVYDAAGLRVKDSSTTYASGKAVQSLSRNFTYDASGRMTASSAVPSGEKPVCCTYTYDDAGHLIRIAATDGTNPTTDEYTYVTRKVPLQKPLPFIDVPAGSYCRDAVKWAVEQEITTGTTATTFSPEQTCTQAQILTFLWRAAGKPEAGSTASYANSVITEKQYYYKALQWAAEKGVVTDMALDPNAKCSRSDAALYLWRYAGSPASSPAAFTDVAADSPYAGAVAWAVENGVTKGTSATTFSPDSSCTRGQIVTFLYRDLGKQ
jgi:YD repeat-containing protein